MTVALTEHTFTPASTRALLEQVCAQAGLDHRDAVELRHQTNAVYLLPANSVIVKISRPAASRDRLTRTLSLVRWMTAQGFATVGPTEHLQPIEAGGCLATLWPYIPQTGLTPISAGDLGAPLRALHRLTPPHDLPRLDAVAAIRHSIATSRVLDTADAHFLQHCCDALAAKMTRVAYTMPPGLIHADPQHRNALQVGGQTALIDWDGACTGQPEWDLVTVEVHCRRFYPDPTEYAAFATAYGHDIRAWHGFATLRDVRELRMIATNARKSAPGSESAAEVHRRILGLRASDINSLWQRL